MNPRYFIGISLPPDITEIITELQRSLYDPKSMLRPLVPHITLLHPNALSTLSPLTFLPKIRDVAKSFLPCTITLESIGSFGKRVLIIQVKSPELIALQEALVALLPQPVIATEYIGKTFTPHVTLAQANHGKFLPPGFRDYFAANISTMLPYLFTTSQLTEFVWQNKREYKTKLI